MKYSIISILVIIFTMGCGSSRSVTYAEIHANISFGGQGVFVDRELRVKYEKELESFNHTLWVVKLFMREPIPPKEVNLERGDLRLAILDNGRVVSFVTINSDIKKYHLAGIGSDLRLVIMQNESYFTVRNNLKNGDRIVANIVPGLVVYKTNDG